MKVKETIKKLYNDDYDAASCYEELMNCLCDLDLNEMKDINKYKYVKRKVLLYFNRCTCQDDTLHELKNIFRYAEADKKEQYCSFLSKLEHSFSGELSKTILGEKSTFDGNTDSINAKPLATILLNILEQQLLDTDASYVEEIIKTDNVHMLKALINEDPEILDVKNDAYGSLLHFSAFVSANNILDYLCTVYKNINLLNERDETPLHMAYKGNNISGIVKLIDKGANRLLKNNFSDSLSEYSIFLKDYYDIDCLVVGGYLKMNFPIENDHIDIAIETGEIGFIKYILEEKLIDLSFRNHHDFSLMSLACLKGNTKLIDYLLGKGLLLDDNSGYYTNTVLAFTSGKKELIERFISMGALDELTEYDKMCIYKNTSSDLESFMYAESIIGELDKHIIEAIKTAVDARANDTIHYLLDKNFDYCVEINSRHTLLTALALMGEPTIVEKILNKETVEHANSKNVPLLLALADNRLFEQMEKALKLGASIDIHHEVGNALTRTIARNPRAHYAKVLLDSGFDVSLYNSNGYTPLHVAVVHNSLELCKLLINYGAKANESNIILKKSPLKLAKEKKFKEIVLFLENNI